MAKELVLILGGARSGKSRYGLGLAARCPAPRLFVATCQPRDVEMEARIEAHQRERGSDWATREVPLKLAAALGEAQDHYGVVVVDCLTMWVTNLLLQEDATPGRIQTAAEDLLAALAATVMHAKRLLATDYGIRHTTLQPTWPVGPLVGDDRRVIPVVPLGADP